MANYAVVIETQYYGPDTKRNLLSVHETREEAEEAAEKHDVGIYLGHNEAGRTVEVYEIVADDRDGQRLVEIAYDECDEDEVASWPTDEDNDQRALESAGLDIVCAQDPDAPRELQNWLWLIRL